MSISLNGLLKKIAFYGLAVCLLLSCSSVYFQYDSDKVLLFGSVFTVLTFIVSLDGARKDVLSSSVVVLFGYGVMAAVVDFMVAYTTGYYYYRFYFFLPLFILICCMWELEKKIEFLKVMEKVIFFLTLSSLVLWLAGPYLHIISPGRSYPISWGIDRIYYSYCGLSFAENAQYKTLLGLRFPRNLSIYPEGPFSNLIFSLGLVLHMVTNTERSKLRMLIYALAIFTSFSTTGWGMLVLILSVDYIKKMSKARSDDRLSLFFARIVLPLVIVVAAVYTFYSVLSMKDATDNYNYQAHMNGFRSGISLFLDHALKGVGIGQSVQYGNTTSGAFRVLGDGGILLALLFIVPILIPLFRSGFGKRNFRIMLFTSFFTIMWVLVIWHYSLLFLFFLGMGYSMMIERIPSDDDADTEEAGTADETVTAAETAAELT